MEIHKESLVVKVVVDPKPRMRSKQHTDRRTLCL